MLRERSRISRRSRGAWGLASAMTARVSPEEPQHREPPAHSRLETHLCSTEKLEIGQDKMGRRCPVAPSPREQGQPSRQHQQSQQPGVSESHR